LIEKSAMLAKLPALIKYKVIKFAVILTVLIIAINLPVPVQVMAVPEDAANNNYNNNNIEIRVEGGYSNTAKLGFYAPFFITVENKGQSISCEVQVIISTDSMEKAAYAKQSDFPQNSKKLITIIAPIATANRKVEVRLVKGSKTIYSTKYDFANIIPPSNPLIGILSEKQGALSNLSGLSMPENFISLTERDIDIKRKLMATAVETAVEMNADARTIQFTEQNFPDEEKALQAFDIIIISNYDTSQLNEKQLKLLDKWVNDGKMLFIGLGPNSMKTYSGLGEEFKPFRIDGSSQIQKAAGLEKLIGKPLPNGGLNIVTGNTDNTGNVMYKNNGHVILEEEGLPLAIAYNKGKGALVILTFDPTLKPVLDWEGEKDLWRKVIADAYAKTEMNTGYMSAYGSGGYNAYSTRGINNLNFSYLASNVPETQRPPFTFLFVTIIIYVLIAGPVLYILLKRKDKRDLSWFTIPAIAVLFTLIIYIAGFKTRYTTAVLNNVSLINLENIQGTASIYTTSAAFNNSRGSMAFSYNPLDSIEIGINSDYYGRPFYGAQPENDDNFKITSKLTYGAENSYQLYNAGMWEPKLIYINKTLPYSGKLISNAAVNKDGFRAIIENNTEFDFKESFINIGDYFFDIGDLRKGEKREIGFSFNDPSIKRNITDFLNDRYGDIYQPSSQRPPVDQWREMRRKREMMDNAYHNLVDTQHGGEKYGAFSKETKSIFFFALNYDDMGYKLAINGKQPIVYNTNLIYSGSSMELKKGENIYLPAGIIVPVPDNMQNVYFDNRNKTMEVSENGNIDFSFYLPENIDIKEMEITWQTSINKIFSFFIFNNKTSEWEEFDGMFRVTGSSGTGVNSSIGSRDGSSTAVNSSSRDGSSTAVNSSSRVENSTSDSNSGDTDIYNIDAYTNNERQIKVRAIANFDKNVDKNFYRKVENIGVPEIELRGVVK